MTAGVFLIQTEGVAVRGLFEIGPDVLRSLLPMRNATDARA
ncbi:MAG: hypothetical protein QOI51_1795 [Nocardioidaceae bacterium]|jgi:hypothetical protein|nr:hypothetical protein [Nocardioidaceae bacterium]MDX6310008.1 hypothetical protein [Nocardioidaceae bacterium]